MSRVGLVLAVAAAGVSLLWFWCVAQAGPEHRASKELFLSFFPSWMHGNILETPRVDTISAVQAACAVAAFLLAAGAMRASDAMGRAVNGAVMLLSLMILGLILWSLA